MTMLEMPFLTEFDSRDAIKGSRDPLGIQQLWTRVGREVVGNLTTVSNSVRDFTTLLLGYHFAAELADDLGPGTELETFLKWEQLAAYARGAVNNDWQFRGSERVWRALDEKQVTVSADRAHQILGNQKIYGLWGLYTVPARASGLVQGDPPRLTPPAALLVDKCYLPALTGGERKYHSFFRDVLRSGASKLEVRGKHAPFMQRLGKILAKRLRPLEREVFRKHVLHGGPEDSTDGRQRQLAEVLAPSASEPNYVWSPPIVDRLVRSVQSKGDAWHSLADRLHRIRTCESVFAPASALFQHLLGMDGKAAKVVVQRLTEAWGNAVRSTCAAEFRELKPILGAIDEAGGERWVAAGEALAAGHYGEFIDLLIQQNKAVMGARGGAPWIESVSGKLKVRFQDEKGNLPKRKDLPELWRFSYFLDSLRAVAAALEGDERG